MGTPTVGSVVLVGFPFADLKRYKWRPAVVVAHSSLGTVIVCQVTSQQLPGVASIPLYQSDFISNPLSIPSYVRPDKLLTIDATVASQRVLGVLKKQKITQLRRAIKQLF